MDYYNGFDANARAEKNKPGVERALEVVENCLGRPEYYDGRSESPKVEGLRQARWELQQELTRIKYLIAEMGAG
jgi:hypothetical protein